MTTEQLKVLHEISQRHMKTVLYVAQAPEIPGTVREKLMQMLGDLGNAINNPALVQTTAECPEK